MGRYVDFFDGDIGRPEALMDIYNATPGTDDFLLVTVGGAPGNDKHFSIAGDKYRTGQLGTDTTLECPALDASQTVFALSNLNSNNQVIIKTGEVVLIDNEIMYVVDGNSNGLEVVRGAFSTTAATHTASTQISWHGTRPENHNRLLVPSENALAVANYTPIANAINFWRDRGEARGNYRAINVGSGVFALHSPENSAVEFEIPVTLNAAGEETTTLATNSLENTTPVGTTTLSGGVKPFSQKHMVWRHTATMDDVTGTIRFVAPFDVVGTKVSISKSGRESDWGGDVTVTGRLVSIANGSNPDFAATDIIIADVYG